MNVCVCVCVCVYGVMAVLSYPLQMYLPVVEKLNLSNNLIGQQTPPQTVPGAKSTISATAAAINDSGRAEAMKEAVSGTQVSHHLICLPVTIITDTSSSMVFLCLLVPEQSEIFVSWLQPAVSDTSIQ